MVINIGIYHLGYSSAGVYLHVHMYLSENIFILKACAHWRGLPHSHSLPRSCGLAWSSGGLVDHAQSKFHTLARSYMRSRESIDRRMDGPAD